MSLKNIQKKGRNIRASRRENRMPKALIIAELFIAVMCISYVFKITGSMMDIAEDDSLYPSVVNVFMLQMNLVFLITTVFALLGVSSRRAESWKTVVKSCFTFTFSTFMSAFLLDSSSHVHAFDFNPYVTAIALGLIVLMMLYSMMIKKFYTPPLTEVLPTRKWANYILFGKLYNVEYRIKMSGEQQADITDANLEQS